MAAGKVEVLQVVGGFDVDRGAEARLVNKDVNIQEGNMGWGDGPSESDRVTTIEALKEKEKGIIVCYCYKKVKYVFLMPISFFFSWYSWSVHSLVNGVYAFGFLFMLPQLFVNYKLKSVAHLPWKAFMYKVCFICTVSVCFFNINLKICSQVNECTPIIIGIGL